MTDEKERLMELLAEARRLAERINEPIAAMFIANAMMEL